MLLTRSILLEVCLVLVASRVGCQSYDYAADEGEDRADFTDDGDHSDAVDYSKYYNLDSSAPLISQNSPQNADSSGFVSPLEFTSFFGPSPIEFGASNNQAVAKTNGFVQDKNINPLDALKQEFPYYSNGPTDYFEESQKKQQLEKQKEQGEDAAEIGPGPNYISHKLPVQYTSEESKDDVETIPPRPNKKNKNKKFNHKPKNDDDFEPSDKNNSPDYSFEPPVNYNKYTDYNTGKSSSTVSQYPTAAGYQDKYTVSPSPTLSPYQKFSFQPVTEGLKSNYFDSSLISTVAPFNPAYTKLPKVEEAPAFEGQSSDNIPSHLRGKSCRKIVKPSAEAMNCFVCNDPETKSKFTQCSYTSESEPINDYSGTSERYSTPGKEPDGFRYKRYSNKNEGDDPYTYIKQRSEKNYNEPTESEQFNEEFQYSPDYYSEDTQPEKSYSELESEEIKKNPANCKKVDKDGMTCTICKNAKTGGNFEQCSYTSEPKEKKYAYVTEKKYDSEQPEESKSVAQTQSKQDPSDKKQKQIAEKQKKIAIATEFGTKLSSEDYEPIEEYEGRRKNNKRPEREHNKKYSRRNEEGREINDEDKEDYAEGDVYHRLKSGEPQKFNKQSNDDDKEEFEDKYNFKESPKNSKRIVDNDSYEVPEHFAEETTKERKTGGSGLDPSLYGGGDDESSESTETKQKKDKYVDEYQFKLFPEFANEESRQEQSHLEYPEENRQDVEEVLAQFSKKDRSNCKKAERNGMTCFLCVDKHKIQHEECMFISESQPKSSHVAYHAAQKIKSPEQQEESENKHVEQVVPVAAETKRKRFFKKVTTTQTPLILEPSASDEYDTVVKFQPKKNPKAKRNNKKSKQQKTAASQYNSERISDSAEPTIKTPQEFEVPEEGGAYSAETRPVYSKTLGVKLPKYMLQKSEFEEEFDAFSGSF